MRRGSIAPACLVALLLLLPAVAVADGADSEPSPGESLSFPMTFDQVWYRTGKKRLFGGGSVTGDLTITPRALELSARKQEIVIPLDRVRTISFGRMRGDVDTEWTVLRVEQGGATDLVGLRDGKKMGFGRRTREIYLAIQEAARRAGAAQYDVPAGLEVFDAFDAQFTLAVPAGWTPYHESAVEVDGRLLWGRIIFSARPVRKPETYQLEQFIERIERGDEAAFFLDRREALPEMRCRGFSGSAERRLLRWVDEDPLLGGAKLLAAPSAEPAPIGDCTGRRVVARVDGAGGADTIVDLRVVSDDVTVYIFGLRRRATDYDEAVRQFDRVVDSFRPSVAR